MSGPRAHMGLAEQAAASGIRTTLITDSSELADHPCAQGFQEVLALTETPATDAARDIDQTQLARLVAEAVDWLEKRPASSPFLLWIHGRGMDGLWDAPSEFREQFADEDDPLPPEFVEPPACWIEPNDDPDRLLGIVHAYAGQVSLLDACLEVFLDACQSLCASSDTLLLLTSARGYPLGEHGRVGPVEQAIYGEHLHVPCLVRYPDGAEATVRSQQLVQPTDMHATLLDWFALPPAASSVWGQSLTAMLRGQAQADRACAIAGCCRALRTPAWFLHRDGDSKLELFAKPDDRWEINEISDRCRNLLPQLTAIMEEFEQATQTDTATHLSPLPQAITEGLE